MSQATLLRPAETERPASVLSLRDYQEAALTASTEAFARGITRQLLSMATGSGKTVTAAHAISRWLAEQPGRALFIVHRDELATQTVRQLAQVNPGLDIGVVKAERNEAHTQVVVASSQTLERPARFAHYQREVEGQRLLVISDEAHHDGLRTRRAAFIKDLNPELLIGMTATPSRGDKTGLDHLYQDIVFHIGIIDLIVLERLSPMVGMAIETGTDITQVRTVAGEFVQSDLERAVDTPGRNQIVVDRWQEHAGERTRTVAFCVDTKHALHLRDAFREAGIVAETVLGSTESDERARIFEAFHEGRVQVLTNCMVLTEGYDEPAIDCIVMARPTKSQGLYIQCAGRGARKAQGKENCLVLDFVDVTRDMSLAAFPTLAGLDPAAVKKPGAGGGAKQAPMDLVAMVESHEKLKVLGERRVNLFASSPLVWRDVAGVHMAPAEKNRWIAVIPDGDGFTPYNVQWTRDNRADVGRLFDRPLDMETAFAVAEAKANLTQLIDREAQWRDLPATQAQVDYARQLGIAVAPRAKRGELSALIDDKKFSRAMREFFKPGREMKA